MRRERGDREEEARRKRQRNIWRGVEGEDREEREIFIKRIGKREKRLLRVL